MAITLTHPSRTLTDADGNAVRLVSDLVADLYSPTLLAWKGQHLVYGQADGWSSGMVWEALPMPAPGETVTAGTFGMNTVTDYAGGYGASSAERTHLEVPLTAWGDYNGSTVERANCLSLVEAYPETFVTVSVGSGECLALALDQRIPKDLYEGLISLQRDYPLWDDQTHSQLEFELQAEMWDAYVSADLKRDLTERFTDNDTATTALDALADDALAERFWEACSETDAEWTCEDAVSATLDRRSWERVAEHVAAAILATL